MSALPPVPYQILPDGDVTPAMRDWMGNMLGDDIGHDNAIIALQGAALAYPSLNALVDGSFQVAQGTPTITLATAAQYSPIDMWAAWVSGGAIVAANAQTTTLNQSTTGGAVLLNYTLTGAGQLSVRQRIESARAKAFATRPSAVRTITSSFSALMFQDTGATVNCVLVINKPTAADNYASVTNVYTSPAFPVPSGTMTTVYFDNIALGNVANGIEVEIQLAVGAVTSKRWFLSDVQLVPIATHPTYVPRPFNEELPLVQRYFQKSFPYGTAPGTGAGLRGALSRQCVTAGATFGMTQLFFATPMRVPNPTMSFFNPQNANANWYSVSRGADSGAAAVLDDGDRSQVISQTQVAADVVGNQCCIHWVADARL